MKAFEEPSIECVQIFSEQITSEGGAVDPEYGVASDDLGW